MLANALAGRARLGQTPFVHHILGRGYRLFDSWHRRSRRPDSQATYKDRGRAREQQEVSATLSGRSLIKAAVTTSVGGLCTARLFASFARHINFFFQRGRFGGAVGLVLLLVGILGAGLATLRQKIISKVRSCKQCSGYGILRCTLCNGRGIVGWEGKWSHQEPCPLCLGRRYVDCGSCGGRFNRPLFEHA